MITIPPFTPQHGSPSRSKIVWAAIVLLLGLFALFGVYVMFANAQGLPTAEAVFDKYIEATGGQAAYDRIENRVTKSTFEFVGQGITLASTIYAAKPNKSYVILESDAYGKIERGTIDDTVWETSLMRGPQIKEGVEKAEALRDATFDKFVYWRKIYKQGQCVGTADVDGKSCYKLIMTPFKGSPQTLYFDTASYLLLKVEAELENPMGKILVESFLDDYKKVDDLLIAHKIRVNLMGQKRIMTTQGITHNMNLPADRFSPPADIQALLDQ